MDLVVGLIIFASTYIMFSVTMPMIDSIVSWAHTQNIDSNVWPIISFVQMTWNYAVIISAAGGILYILYAPMRQEVETRYG